MASTARRKEFFHPPREAVRAHRKAPLRPLAAGTDCLLASPSPVTQPRWPRFPRIRKESPFPALSFPRFRPARPPPPASLPPSPPPPPTPFLRPPKYASNTTP